MAFKDSHLRLFTGRASPECGSHKQPSRIRVLWPSPRHPNPCMAGLPHSSLQSQGPCRDRCFHEGTCASSFWRSAFLSLKPLWLSVLGFVMLQVLVPIFSVFFDCWDSGGEIPKTRPEGERVSSVRHSSAPCRHAMIDHLSCVLGTGPGTEEPHFQRQKVVLVSRDLHSKRQMCLFVNK